MPDPADQKSGATTDLVPSGQSGSLVPAQFPTTGAAGKPIPIRITAPEVLLRHNISDEQLDMFAEGSRDGMSEAFWAFVAAALGALPAAGEALVNAFWLAPAVPLSAYHLIEVILVVGCFAIAGAIKVMWRRKTKTVSSLVEKIRSQGKTGIA